MPQENVESSGRAWDRFMAGDIAGMLAYLDRDVEVREPPDLPGASVYHGHAGWQTQVEKFAEAFTDFTYERVECIDCGDDVVSVIRATGIATSSGIPGEVSYATGRDLACGKGRLDSVLQEPGGRPQRRGAGGVGSRSPPARPFAPLHPQRILF